jgi:hypothetical protein
MEFQGQTFSDPKLSCNRENMTKLVTALESGDYRQGQGYLLTVKNGERKHCCLGVACDISGLGEWGPDSGVWPDYAVEGELYEDASNAELPGAVMEWLGIDTHSMALGFHVTGDMLAAAELNDAVPSEEYPETYDFQAIAARIREVYLTD